MRALGLALMLAWMACLPGSLAQIAASGEAHEQSAAMVALLRRYLDDGYVPAEGPDTGKAFIRECIGRG